MDKFGFIILRHVNSELTDRYWKECYNCIRKLYDNKIIIIDDNSDKNFLKELDLINTVVIQSEFPKSGELLPYIYFAKTKWFDNAVILHDSVFIKEKINTEINNYKFLWHFEHDWDVPNVEIPIILKMNNNSDILKFYLEKEKWKGCFGVMSIVNHEFIKFIDKNHNLINLTEIINSRLYRQGLERVMACLFQYYHKIEKISYLGDIIKYTPWGYTFDEYLENKRKLPIVKVWTGR